MARRDALARAPRASRFALAALAVLALAGATRLAAQGGTAPPVAAPARNVAPLPLPSDSVPPPVIVAPPKGGSGRTGGPPAGPATEKKPSVPRLQP